jgi:hypothetical protein
MRTAVIAWAEGILDTEGLEPDSANSQAHSSLRQLTLSGAAKSGATDYRLAIVRDAWTRLPDEVHAAILALVRPFLNAEPGFTLPNTLDAG